MKSKILFFSLGLLVGISGTMISSRSFDNDDISSKSQEINESQETKKIEVLEKYPDKGMFKFINNGKHSSPANWQIWEDKGEKIFTPNFPKNIGLLEINIRRRAQQGIDIIATFENGSVKIPFDYSDAHGIDRYGNLYGDSFIEITEHDFDNDGIPEILVASTDTGGLLSLKIYKYYPSAQKSNNLRMENWAEVGNFTGQFEIRLEDDTIYLPFGSQGLYDSYVWVKNKFLVAN